MLFGVMIGCEAIGQKHALLTANINLFPTAGVPPLGPGLLPAKSPEEEALHEEITRANRQLFERGLPSVNGPEPSTGCVRWQGSKNSSPPPERMLLGTSQAFDFAPEVIPPHIRYVGPQLDDPAWAAEWHSPWSEDDRRPLVLVSFSTSFQDHAAVLQRIIDAAADLPVRLLVTLGATISPDELRPAPNSRLVETAPHNAVMPKASLVITHGEHGTVTRALVHRKPLIVVPHGRDQNDNAVRVSARGAGLVLGAQSSAEEFSAAIRQMLSDPGFGAAAKALGDGVAADAEHSPVVAELERIASCASASRSRQAA
jgi:UDP:flavonoid glycosyltransferase YjiC (YdhE family)